MLIERCKKGDRSAQYKIYNMYSKAMFNTCYRITNSIKDSEDILQEAFVSAFTNIHQYRGDASFGSWLKRIVVNHAINYAKKNKTNYLPIDNIDTNNLMPTEESKEDKDQIILSASRIRECLKELPEGYRTVFSLYLIEGYSHKEIATILNISESTSKSQYNRAKNRIRELLKLKKS